MQTYDLDLDKYESINDIIFDSYGCIKPEYRCFIACKVIEQRNIHIWNIIDKEENKRSIAYLNKGDKIVVKIADDFNQVIFSNGIEHYLLNGDN